MRSFMLPRTIFQPAYRTMDKVPNKTRVRATLWPSTKNMKLFCQSFIAAKYTMPQFMSRSLRATLKSLFEVLKGGGRALHPRRRFTGAGFFNLNYRHPSESQTKFATRLRLVANFGTRRNRVAPQFYQRPLPRAIAAL